LTFRFSACFFWPQSFQTLGAPWLYISINFHLWWAVLSLPPPHISCWPVHPSRTARLTHLPSCPCVYTPSLRRGCSPSWKGSWNHRHCALEDESRPCCIGIIWKAFHFWFSDMPKLENPVGSANFPVLVSDDMSTNALCPPAKTDSIQGCGVGYIKPGWIKDQSGRVDEAARVL